MAEKFVIDDIMSQVDEKVVSLNANMTLKLVDRIATQRLNEREQLLFDALPKYGELKNELSKLTRKSDNDMMQRGQDGKFVNMPGWKPETVKKIQEAEKKLQDFKQAYVWAIDGRYKNAKDKWVDDPEKLTEEERKTLKKIPDYEPLKKFVKGGSSGADSKATTEEPAAAE